MAKHPHSPKRGMGEKLKSVHNKVGPNQLGTFNVNRFIYQGFNKPKATPENKSKSGGQLKGSMTSRKWK